MHYIRGISVRQEATVWRQLRLVGRVLRHARLWRHAVRRRSTALHVALVGHGLGIHGDVRHIAGWHVWVLLHSRPAGLRGEV